jgi:hypothetical protein
MGKIKAKKFISKEDNKSSTDNQLISMPIP